MSSELLIIIAIVFVLVYLQVTLVKSGKNKIKILQSVFNHGSDYKPSNAGSKDLYETREIYIPKYLLKNITWDDIKQNTEDYSCFTDDVTEEKVFNKREFERSQAKITAIRHKLDACDDSEEREFLKEELKEALKDFENDQTNGKFEIVERTVTCKKEDKEKIQIIFLNNTNPIAEEIEKSINTYLLRNKGAVSDFNLIKDIVERNSDAVATEIESLTPMPLYLGLAGTMSGIAVGLGIIGFTTGFGDIQNVVDSLMSEVALAMVVSLLGVISTTYVSWKSRGCNATIEADKNKFYTWIQTELLPVLSSNTVSTLTLLERNLTKFNESFGSTIVKLDEKLSQVGDTYGQQLEILRRIQQLDMTKMATANVRILTALDSSSSKLEGFAKYMDNTTTYLTEVRRLTDELDSYLARTGSLEIIAEFYKKQMTEIASRQDAIRSTVVSVDDAVQRALANLEEHTEQGLTGLKRTYVKQQDEMEKLAQQQGGMLNDKLKKLDTAIEFISEIRPIVDKIGRMEGAINSAAKRAEVASHSEITAINNLADAIRKNRTIPVGEKKGFFAKTRSFFTRKIDVDTETPQLTAPHISNPKKGQWYEQGKQQRINK